MKRPLSRALVAGSLLMGVFAAYADKNEWFDDRYYVVPMGSLAVSDGSRSEDNASGGALAIGKSVVPHFGVEILGNYLHYRGKTVSTPTTGLNCGLLRPCSGQGRRVPSQDIVSGGIGVNYYLSPDNEGVFVHANVEGGDRFMYNAGLGFDRPMFNRTAYFRLEALYHKEASYSAEPLFQVGFRIPFGAEPEPVQAALTPVTVVPLVEPDQTEVMVSFEDAGAPAAVASTAGGGEAVPSESTQQPSGDVSAGATAAPDVEPTAAPISGGTAAVEHPENHEQDEPVHAVEMQTSPPHSSESAATLALQDAHVVPAADFTERASPDQSVLPPTSAHTDASPGEILDSTEADRTSLEAAPSQTPRDAGPAPDADSTTALPDETLAPTEPASAPPGFALAQAPQEHGLAPVAADDAREVPVRATPAAAPSDEVFAPTEPAPAPPQSETAQAPQTANLVHRAHATQGQSAPSRSSVPSTEQADNGLAPTEPAPAPPQSP